MNENCEFFWYEDAGCVLIITSISTIVCVESKENRDNCSWEFEVHEFNGLDFDEVDYWIDEAD